MNVTDTINQDKTPPHGHSGAPSIMPSAFEEPFREPLVLGNPTLHDITEKISSIPLLTPNLKFLIPYLSLLRWLCGDLRVWDTRSLQVSEYGA